MIDYVDIEAASELSEVKQRYQRADILSSGPITFVPHNRGLTCHVLSGILISLDDIICNLLGWLAAYHQTLFHY